MIGHGTAVRVGARLRAGVVSRLGGHLDPAAPPPAPPVAVSGVVEHFTRRRLSGWVSVPADSPPTIVSLRASGTELIRTTATPGRTDRRTGQQVRSFAIQVHGIWGYLRRRNRLTVRVGGQPLPIVGYGMFRRPRHDGEHSLADLKALLAHGHLVDRHGRLVLDKRLDTEWKTRTAGLYARCSAVLREQFGYDLVIVYGTLLGAIRGGEVIAHDDDFDTAYVSRHRHGEETADEAVDVALALIDAGLIVDAKDRVLHIHDPEDPDYRIDIFHTFADEHDQMRFPWGIAGRGALPRSAMTAVRELDFEGSTVLAPVEAERVLAHLYGEDWREPKAGWSWRYQRTDHAADAIVSVAQRTRVYWSNHYARTGYAGGSSFFEFVLARNGLPGQVIDLGCGDGRDAVAFGASGRRVLGLDQSAVGVGHAEQHAAARGQAETTRFRACDVTDPQALGPMLQAELALADGPVLFYLRFFLHAIDETAETRLLRTVASYARPGDWFAAEFRTEADAELPKTYGNHYRRFQSASSLAAKLTTAHGFDLVYEHESAGLSPYRDEDPVLGRVIALKR